VVDDIWKVDEWDAIKCAFPRTSSGSKIITTTRINDVAELCRSSFSGHIYNLRPLNTTQSRQLLYARLFNSVEKCPLDLEEISGQILEKCAL
jgi:disease resistance protein RPM1